MLFLLHTQSDRVLFMLSILDEDFFLVRLSVDLVSALFCLEGRLNCLIVFRLVVRLQEFMNSLTMVWLFLLVCQIIEVQVFASFNLLGGVTAAGRRTVR